MRLVFSFLALFLVTTPASAQSGDEDLPRSGTLSGTYTGAFEGVQVPGVWGEDENVLSDDKPPITGSVSQVNRQEWKMRLFNNSVDDYSVSIKVIQYDKRKNKTKSDNFSYRLKAGENVSRPISARNNTHTAELQLLSWKNLTNREKEAPADDKK